VQCVTNKSFKMKKVEMLKSQAVMLVLAIALAAPFASCKKDKEEPKKVEEPKNEESLSGEISGTLEKGTYTVTGNLIVPAGKELKLMPGVILAFDGDGLSPETSPELQLLGDLIAVGTEAEPILFTVIEERRNSANAYDGLWGGIQAMSSCKYLILKHTVVEYCGGPAQQSEAYDAGDPRYTIHFANPEGVLVVENSIIRHHADDCIRPQGGAKIAIINNKFYNVGETGGEGLNAKDGTVGVVAYNLFYSIATNGSKPAGPGDGTVQTNIDTYNNTFINSGFRRSQAGRGGSINYEDGAKGQIHNNLIVNCRFGIRLRGDDLPDLANTHYSHNHYYAYDAADQENFWPMTDLDESGKPITIIKDGDIIQKDPMFASYSVSTDKLENIPASYTAFRLTANSPGLKAGKTDFNPVFSSLSAGGFTITIPGPSEFIGAFGN
jgi:hypothetical protein